MQQFQTSVHYPSNCSSFLFFLWRRRLLHYTHIRYTACVSTCHLQTPTTTFPSTLLPFCSWTSPLPPNILYAMTTCISSMQKWKLRLCGCTLSLKCHMLRPEYQLLVFDACCWTQIAPLAPAVAAHPKFDKALWGQHIPSEVTPISH